MPMNNVKGSGFALIYDFQTKSWLLRIVPQEVTCAFSFNNKIFIGTEDGKVLQEFKGKTFDGKTINSYYKSPWFDWANNYNQSFAEFIIEIDNEQYNQFNIETQKDGQSRPETRTIDSDDLYQPSMLWAYDGDDERNSNLMKWDDNNWLRATFETLRMLLPNNVFEKFQLEIGTNDVNQGFAIYGYAFRRIETEEAPW